MVLNMTEGHRVFFLTGLLLGDLLSFISSSLSLARKADAQPDESFFGLLLFGRYWLLRVVG
jgi:hypothetical protein